MALSSRPTARLGGLPSGPATARSRSLQRGEPDSFRSASVIGDDTRNRTMSSPSNPPAQLRHQRSFSSGSGSGRSRGRRTRDEDVPPLPPLPTQSLVANKLSKLKGDRNGSVSSVSSASSSLSGSSSSSSGFSTSVTSVDESGEDDKYEEGGFGEEDPSPPGVGSSLWSKITTAAGNLSVSVSQAWAANITTSSGELTPPGQESRLTRALKAYHIAQAKNPRDLPEWLFDEKERGLTSKLPLKEVVSEDPPPSSALAPEPPRPKATATPFPTRNNTRYYDVDMEKATMSRAAQRLKELRDAKANPRVKFADTPHPRRVASGQSAESEGTKNEVARQPTSVTAVAPEQPVSISRRPMANVDISGKRPTAQGLPSGVRPRRT